MIKDKNYFTVFICHRRKEDKGAPIGSYLARILYEYLKNNNISAFYDVECLGFGDDYRKLTKYYIETQVRYFILILTPDIFNRCSNSDDAVFNEIRLAIDKFNSEDIDDGSVLNKFQFVPINPDNLFDFNKNLPKSLLPEVSKRISSNNACDISFSKKAFKTDISSLVKDITTKVLSPSAVDKTNKAAYMGKNEIAFIQTDDSLFSRIMQFFTKTK